VRSFVPVSIQSHRTVECCSDWQRSIAVDVCTRDLHEFRLVDVSTNAYRLKIGFHFEILIVVFSVSIDVGHGQLRSVTGQGFSPFVDCAGRMAIVQQARLKTWMRLKIALSRRWTLTPVGNEIRSTHI
jgi:hypothetical protein